MARIYQTGFEMGEVVGGTLSSGGGVAPPLPTVVTGTPTPRSGSYCLKATWNNVNTNDPGDFAVVRAAHATVAEVWYAFGVQVVLTTAEDATSYGVLFRDFDAVGNCNLVLRFDAGTLRLYRANAAAPIPTQAQLTLVGSASASMSQSAWHLIEVRHLCATGATGAAEVYLDGTQVISASSVITCPTNANAAEFELGYRRIGGSSNTGSGNLSASYDDVRVNSTAGTRNNGRPLDEQIRLIVPSGPGDLTQLTRGGTDSGANWSQVDEIPATGSTDYVSGSTIGLTDLYQTTDFPVTSVSAIGVLAQIANSDGAGGTVNLPTKTAAGQSDGSAYLCTAAWTIQQRLLETDPADGAAWDTTKIGALQVGVKIAS